MGSHLVRSGLLVAFFLIMTSCQERSSVASVQEVASPAGDGSMASRLSVGGDGEVYLSWLEEADGDAYALRWSRWGVNGWSAARTVTSGANWFVNWADLPSVSAFADGTLFAHWLEMNGDLPYAYAVRVARSPDGGATWTAASTLHDDGSPAEHGFVSFVPEPGSSAGLFWLDGRAVAGQHGDGAGATQLMFRRLRSDGSADDELVIDERVCDCCQTSALRLADGRIVVAFRDRSPEEVRDIGVATLDSRDAVRAGPFPSDGWRIAGCPVNGPAIASDGQRVGMAWFTTGADDRPRVLVSISQDGAQSFGDPVEVSGRTARRRPWPLGRVGAAFDDDHALWVSYIERSDDDAVIYLRRVTVDGTLGEAWRVARTSPSRASGFPQIARSADGLLVTWTDAGDPKRLMTAAVR